MPFPATRVIHTKWAAHHRPTAIATLTGTCTITTEAGSDWTPEDGAVAGTPTTHYTGLCSVSRAQRTARLTDAAGQTIAPTEYVVGIDPDAAAIPNGARVHVDSCDDPRLTGLNLVVRTTAYDTVLLERVLGCDLDLANQG
ncbi:DUF6093 family protein [Actinotalea sp. M2MS4P-6]|uniref:DUF6093 family protein n=1 Tax=Actinotalea sp. M2MS4P-6 TaxID=2983762 RepID=UPI0021E402D9|nr:DUF6093 family protein [Actinotalea sp. M2MS4P-6]MCV2395926.1 DUF6093 family protein [Actinotalea sp. M2MS4P-6]